MNVATSGPDQNVAGYLVSLDTVMSRTVPTNGRTTFPDLASGEYSVSLAGRPVNCTGDEAAQAVVTAPETTEVQFVLDCVPLVGTLEIALSTRGSNRDPALLLYLEDEPPTLLLAGETLSIDRRPGDYSLKLGGIAPNCDVVGSASREVHLEFGSGHRETVEVNCAPAIPRILFSSTRGDQSDPFHTNPDLYAMNADGGDVLRLTTGAGAMRAAWSPDGTKLAFQADRDGNNDIFVVNADGSGEVRLTMDPLDDSGPQWSPDGTRIVFERGERGTPLRNVWIMDADGGNQQQITTDTRSGSPTWSPDGNRIAFAGEGDGATTQIRVMDVDGANPIQLTTTTHAYSTHPRWSPNGKKILFVSPRDGAFGDIFVMDADGTDPVNLTKSPGGTANEDPSWSPDGSRIVFYSNRDDANPEIFVMRADGTDVENISDEMWGDYTPSWRPF